MGKRTVSRRPFTHLAMMVLLTGCGIFGPDSEARVRAELVRLPGESASAAVGPAAAPAQAPPPAGITSDVTVTSLRIPITLVELRGPGDSARTAWSART